MQTAEIRLNLFSPLFSFNLKKKKKTNETFLR